MRLWARLKVIVLVLALLWVPVFIAVVSGGGANATAWWIAGFLGLPVLLIAVAEAVKAIRLARDTPARALPAAFLTWLTLGWVRRWAKVDRTDVAPGVKPLDSVWTQRVRAAPGGFRAEIRVTHDEDVPRWQTTAGAVMRALLLNGSKGHTLRISLEQTGVMIWRVMVSDRLLKGVNWNDVGRGACAVSEDGEQVNFPRFHTLIVGATGSGKGSILWGIVRSELKAAESGIAPRFYGADPKQAELAGPVSSLFAKVGYDPDEIARVIEYVHDEVLVPRKGGGRSFEPTPERPPVYLIVDELPSLYGGMERAQAKEAAAKYDQILRQGRSLGVIVIAASQEATKEVISARNSYGWRVAGRLETPADTDMLMGQGAREAGCEPHRIAVATPANGYLTAGIAYVQDETGLFTRVRFPYTSDDELEQIGYDYADLTVLDELNAELDQAERHP